MQFLLLKLRLAFAWTEFEIGPNEIIGKFTKKKKKKIISHNHTYFVTDIHPIVLPLLRGIKCTLEARKVLKIGCIVNN